MVGKLQVTSNVLLAGRVTLSFLRCISKKASSSMEPGSEWANARNLDSMRRQEVHATKNSISHSLLMKYGVLEHLN